jgi:hypothetical protein
MMVVMVSTIVTVVSTVVAMIRMVIVHGMASSAPVSPASRENTTGRGEQGDDAYCIKNRSHRPKLPTD